MRLGPSWMIQAAVGMPKCSVTMKIDRILGLGVVILALWAGVMGDAVALTLGRARAAVLLGQPLSVTIPVQYDGEDDVSPTCFRATVYYGDSVQGSDRTSLSFEAAKTGGSGQLRITSSSIVNEPLVQVELTSSCRGQSTRRFTFLTDVAAETLGTVEARAPVPAVAASVAPPAAATIKTEPRRSAAAAGASASGAPKAVRKLNVAGSKAAASSEGKSRLKLSPSESAGTKGGVKTASPDQSQLVQELQARIDELTQKQAASEAEKARMQALEADLQALRGAATKHQQNVQLLTAAVAKAEEEKTSPTLVYGLVAALLASVAALGYVVMKRSEGGGERPWWSGAGGASAGQAAKVPVAKAPAAAKTPAVAQHAAMPPVAPQPKPQAVTPMAPPAASVVDTSSVDIDIGVSAEPEKATSGPEENPVQRSDRRDFSHSGAATLRAINTREMLDVRQQAEFFMALGQHDEAIKVLEGNVISSPDSNPLIYLDLLRVLHTLSRREDFEKYRKEFNLIFTGQVPEYAEFSRVGVPLEEYNDIVDQIVELWPSDDAMEYIEQCLVRTPEDEPEHGFELEAFRDLLFLHGVLRRLERVGDSHMVPFSTSRGAVTAPAPVMASRPEPAQAAAQAVDGIAPLPALSEAAQPTPAPAASASVDLNLNAAPPAADNLIDFDISTYLGKGSDKPPTA